jgi:hypothetical protein
MTTSTFDQFVERVEAGERLSAEDIHALGSTPDILPLGMLADALRRKVHATRVTYVRVASCKFDAAFSEAVPPAAREIRVTGTPDSMDVATSAISAARAVAGDRTVAAFSWRDVERLADGESARVPRVLNAWRDAGLDTIADLALDTMSDPPVALRRLKAAGFDRLTVGIEKVAVSERVALLLAAAALQDELACIHALNPLPAAISHLRPTTGYEDVKMVAIGRLAAPNIPTIQVDWPRYGPKLAQVALTFGADDVYGVSPSDDAPEGRRRAPLEEIRRNIEAAGFEAVERSGWGRRA